MVYRCFTEKKAGFDVAAQGLLHDLRENLSLSSLEKLRIFCRYDAEGLDDATYAQARHTVFAEPMCDLCFDETLPAVGQCRLLAVEALPGQYDQRADSCAQCIQMLTCGDRPAVSSATVYAFYGSLTDAEFEKVKTWLINPVDSREAAMEKPATLQRDIPAPRPVSVIEGFIAADEAGLSEILERFGLAMDLDDLRFMQAYFRDEEKRDPTVTELKLVDTYWSDHCRHTTFGTHLENVDIQDAQVKQAYADYLAAREEVYGPEKAAVRPRTLMDIATLGTKVLKKRGGLQNLDVSEEINACSIHIDVDVNGKTEDWLLQFKNETHNHPTEIEPFGGAATCIGGAIRDPLAGRAYVYQAMRVTGAADPTRPVSETIPGKLPQRKLTQTAAAGYSSYGNQIGLATGLVHEIYHPGYVAKRMEVGAVVGAAPYRNVVRVEPAPGDLVILLGGRTGRDGCGGATGSSKTHNTKSLTTMASEVQKGNAPEERKLQRLFRDGDLARMIKRCNDFGAGGVSVAIGELADGLIIDLSKVKKKYEGLDGTELAISESQERMAVVVAPENAERFIAKAAAENLEATVVAQVTESPRMVMELNGRVIANLSRAFLSSNGAAKHADAFVPAYKPYDGAGLTGSPAQRLKKLAGDLRFCSQRGLGERFDGSIGAGSVLMPYGGKTQLSPAQVMAALLPVQDGETETCSVMAFGFDPARSMHNPFDGAKSAVITSVAKLVAVGCDPEQVYLSLQEYFERLRDVSARWGKPLAALLGALNAQLGLGVAAIGGKDSMSGTFMDIDVPPTLISFAIAPCKAGDVISNEFKSPRHYVYAFPAGDSYAETRQMWNNFRSIAAAGSVQAAWAVTEGGAMEGILKMALGNTIGFAANEKLDPEALFACKPGTIIAECSAPVFGAPLLGQTIAEPQIELWDETVTLEALSTIWENTLEKVFPTRAGAVQPVEALSYDKRPAKGPALKLAAPRAVIPVFPGTNCEYDTAQALRRAGAEPKIVIIRNLTPAMLEESVADLEKAIHDSQMIVLPGGFSGGDEPDGSGKFISAFFRNPKITDAVHTLLKSRDGLMLGICNGFQALIKLGLVPFGEIRPLTAEDPTLTFNLIGRHQSRYVTTRIASVHSPWLSQCQVGQLHTVPVSHGEGRFVAPEAVLQKLAENGQLATQYADEAGNPSMDIAYNPNGSMLAVEGILSPDGRVFGKMAHTERRGPLVARNIPGDLYQPIFEGGVSYFK